MANKRDLLIAIESRYDDSGFKSAQASAQIFQRELAKQDRAERQLAAMQIQAAREDAARTRARLDAYGALGKGVTAFGLVTAAGMGLAAKSAMDWESAWAGVTKTVDGSASEMDALEGQLRGLARTMPATHEEIAGVAEAAGQLGVKRQDVAGFTKTMIDLGVSTNLTADEAATSIAQISNVMGTMGREGAQGVERFGSALVELGNNGASTERDIVMMATRIAGAARVVGMSEADLLALSNALSSVGIEAEAGGTAISKVLVAMSKSVKQSSDELSAFARVSGMTAQQFSQEFSTAPAEAMASFVKGLGRIKDSGGDVFTTLEGLGMADVRVSQSLLNMSGAGDLLTESLKLGRDAWRDNLALLEEANKRYATAESRIAIARNQLNDAAIDIGGTVLPAIAGAASKVGALSEAFTNLPGPVKETVGVLGGIVTTLSLAGGAALMAIPKFAALNETLQTMGPRGAAMSKGLSGIAGVLTGPWGLALGGATLALGYWANKQLEAEAAQKQLADALDQQTGALTDNARAIKAKQLQDDGTYKSAKELGISLDLVTEAALGNADAMAQLTAMESEYTDTATAKNRIAATMQQKRAQLYKDLVGVVRGSSEALSEDAAKIREVADASGVAANDGQKFTGGLEDQADAADDATTALKKLSDEIAAYGGEARDAEAAESAFQAAIDDADAAAKKNGQTLTTNRKALDLNSEAGRDNAAALREIAEAGLKSASATLDLTGSTGQAQAKVKQARKAFLEAADAMGLGSKEANRLADQMGLIPKNVKPKVTADTKQATSAAQGVKNRLAEIHDRHIDITVGTGRATAAINAIVSRLNSVTARAKIADVLYAQSAYGNVVNARAYAGGGYTPGIYADGVDIVRFAEKGTGGEAYIPFAPDRRDRAIEVWQEAGRRLGMGSSTAVGAGSGLDVNALARALADVLGPAVAQGAWAGTSGGMAVQTAAIRRGRR